MPLTPILVATIRGRRRTGNGGAAGSVSSRLRIRADGNRGLATTPAGVSPGLASHIEAQGLELKGLPSEDFDLDDVGICWAEYIECREATPRNLLAFTGALSVPLTILRAIRLLGLYFQPKDVIFIDLPGSRVLELCNLEATFTELGRALPDNRIRVRLVGPEMGGEIPDGEPIQFRNVRITLHRQLYQDLLATSQSKRAPMPDLVVAFHAGIQEYRTTWIPAISAISQLGIPLVVTGYSLSDITAGLREVKAHCQPVPPVFYEGLNPFACLERMLVDETLGQIIMLKDGDQPNLLFGVDAQNQEVESAGGLLRLVERTDPEMAKIVSINSWWFVIWDEEAWNASVTDKDSAA